MKQCLDRIFKIILCNNQLIVEDFKKGGEAERVRQVEGEWQEAFSLIMDVQEGRIYLIQR